MPHRLRLPACLVLVRVTFNWPVKGRTKAHQTPRLNETTDYYFRAKLTHIWLVFLMRRDSFFGWKNVDVYYCFLFPGKCYFWKLVLFVLLCCAARRTMTVTIYYYRPKYLYYIYRVLLTAAAASCVCVEIFISPIIVTTKPTSLLHPFWTIKGHLLCHPLQKKSSFSPRKERERKIQGINVDVFYKLISI